MSASGVALVLDLIGALVLGVLLALVVSGHLGTRSKWHLDWILSIGREASSEADRRSKYQRGRHPMTTVTPDPDGEPEVEPEVADDEVHERLGDPAEVEADELGEVPDGEPERGPQSAPDESTADPETDDTGGTESDPESDEVTAADWSGEIDPEAEPDDGTEWQEMEGR